jgi:hypothetical protein
MDDGDWIVAAADSRSAMRRLVTVRSRDDGQDLFAYVVVGAITPDSAPCVAFMNFGWTQSNGGLLRDVCLTNPRDHLS